MEERKGDKFKRHFHGNTGEQSQCEKEEIYKHNLDGLSLVLDNICPLLEDHVEDGDVF